MNMHPDLISTYLQFPENMMENLEELDKLFNPIEIPLPNFGENITITDRYITSYDGYDRLRLRIFSPTNIETQLPGVLWIHGGGLVGGSLELEAEISKQIFATFDCILVLVDYRVSTIDPYPTPVEDCYASLQWIDENRDTLKIGGKLAVAGASAGGGLAIATSMIARDRNGPQIDFLMPLYPMMDHREKKESNRIVDTRVWNDDINQMAWSLYLSNLKSTDIPKYAVPALENDYSGLPPVYTCVGDLDPFYTETIKFVDKLKKCKIPAEVDLYPQCFHCFEMMIPNADISIMARNKYLNALRKALVEI